MTKRNVMKQILTAAAVVCVAAKLCGLFANYARSAVMCLRLGCSISSARFLASSAVEAGTPSEEASMMRCR